MSSSSSSFEMVSFPVGSFQCNCSIIWDPQSREAIVVDPGAEEEKIIDYLQNHKLKVQAILHTHAHFDHIGGSHALSKNTEAPLLLHQDDLFLWDNLPMQGRLFGFDLKPVPTLSSFLEDTQVFTFGPFKIETLHTPGHTPGSCCFSLDSLVFAGDTLFSGSVGRTDLWGGDFHLLQKSIKERLYSLPKDTKVICGHGPSTEIGIEKKTNPFVQG